jgi:hypothetical protein
MKAIVFNNLGSRLNQQLESFSLRVSYLLADYVASAGNSSQDIWFDDVFKGADPISQLMVIETFYKNTNEPMAEAGQFKDILKKLAKVKHPNPQQIMIRKNLEKKVEALFKAVVAEMRTVTELTGLMELEPLLDGKTFGLYPMNGRDPEDEGQARIAASKLLTFQLPDPEQGPEFFFLSAEFMLAEFTGKGTVYYAHEPEAAHTENCWMHKCFTLPNINLLKAVELQAVRQQLTMPGAEFRKQCDNWMKGDEGRSGEESIAQFRKNILPHVASLQAAILQNEVLRHCSSIQNHEAKIDLYMGEVPLPILWNYFEHYKVIQEPTRKKLNELLENDKGLNRRIPVMHLSSANAKQADENTAAAREEVPEVKPVKKSISVD